MHTGPLHWPGGEHDFALNLGQLRALQDATDSGPEEVLNRLRLGNWRVNDLIDTIRLGLVGSDAMSKEDASKTVLALFDQHPKVEFKLTAIAILAAALLGVPGDPVGEGEGQPPAPENGGSANSTAPVQ
ncbi:gene transfer agent family protein [uncultured Roseobacter sp.]|uniref:gene transfer agent family protein n=1 Tax=uncultured Roseobacter sp. TaxID=114847 RepID=UPI00262C675D|nr:gene transfer agent family protein [uncultured Roseobacter sp.]